MTSQLRLLSRLLVAGGGVGIAVAGALGLLPVSPAACGSLLAPAFPHALPVCAEAQWAFLPWLLVMGMLGLALASAGVIALPQGRRRHRPS